MAPHDLAPSPKPGAAALEKGVALFVAIVRDGGRTALDVLVARQGLPSSTARRLLAVFERQGLVQRIDRGRYAAGPALAALAPMADPHRILAATARPLLRRLARRMKVTAHLGVLEGDMVTYLVKEQGGENPIFTREGGQLEAYCSGIGKVLLAHQPAALREDYLRGGAFVRLTESTIVDPAALRAEFLHVRRRGYAIDDGEIDDSIRCLAVPVAPTDACTVAAISVTVPRERARPGEAIARVATLQRCAAAIAARMLPLAGSEPA